VLMNEVGQKSASVALCIEMTGRSSHSLAVGAAVAVVRLLTSCTGMLEVGPNQGRSKVTL
jgi:hypothetical protein